MGILVREEDGSHVHFHQVTAASCLLGCMVLTCVAGALPDGHPRDGAPQH